VQISWALEWQAIILQTGAAFTVFDPAGRTAYELASPASTATFTPAFGCGNAPSSDSIHSRLANSVNPVAYRSDPFAPLSTGGTSDATVCGNTPRNRLIWPPQKNVDFTLEKLFETTEGQNLRFRTDFFNMFNHPSFANPSSAVVAAPGSANNGRGATFHFTLPTAAETPQVPATGT
jgi:hypothetical protein